MMGLPEILEDAINSRYGEKRNDDNSASRQ